MDDPFFFHFHSIFREKMMQVFFA